MSVKLLENIKTANCPDLTAMFAVPLVVPAIDADPLAPDEDDDPVIMTTERRLRRVAIVAADTGARFERDGIRHDPAAWMLAPRQMFHGARPIDACQSLLGFTRGVLLHGLSLGLDADPATLDDLSAADDDYERDAECEVEDRTGGSGHDDDHADHADLELYTCVIEEPHGTSGRRSIVVVAMTAESDEIVRDRIALRFGERAAVEALVERGVEDEDERITRLVPPAIMQRLERIATHGPDETDVGFEYVVEVTVAA